MRPVTGFALLAAYGIVMILIAIVINRRSDVSSSAGFFVANRRATAPFIAISFMATFMWGADLLAVPETVYLTGIAGIWMYGIPIVIGGFAIIPIANRLRTIMPSAMTYQEFFRKRLDNKNHLLFVGIGIYTMLVAGALQLRAAGQIIGGIASIEPILIASSVALIVMIYSVITGIWASVSTDVVQVATTVVLTLVFIPYMVTSAGGIPEVHTALTDSVEPSVMLSFSSPDWGTLYAFFLPFLLGWSLWGIASMSVWQRAMSVRKDKISRTFLIGSIGWFSTIPLYGIVGLLALALFPDLARPDAAGIEVYTTLLGGVAAIVFVATLLGLVFSTTDSAILALSLLGTRDVYKQYINPEATNGETVRIARLCIVGFTALTLVTTYVIWTVDFLTLIWINSIGITAVFFPLLYSLYWRQTSANAVFVTSVIVIGVIVSMLASGYDIPLIYLVGHGIAAVLTPALSLAWPAEFEFDELATEETA